MEIDIDYSIGDTVLMCYPKENIGRINDHLTGLGLIRQFPYMDGHEFIIKDKRRLPYYEDGNEHGKIGERYVYRLEGNFEHNGKLATPGGFVYEGYWLSPLMDEVIDDMGVNFY